MDIREILVRYKEGSPDRGSASHLLGALTVGEFVPEFFGLTEDEGRLMDPQERVFLETAWEALEDAGCTGSRLDALTGTGGRPRAVGVFAADYLAALWRSGHVERLTGPWLSGVEIDWFALEGGPSGGRRHAPTPPPPSVFLRRPLWPAPDGAVPVSRERRG
ncbi:beta-ketoacyl synthase N-terminal-like domain-containing protein [Streptomyces prasinus]